MIRFVPNMITIIRILLVGVFCSMFASGRHKAALVVYLTASISDVVDGWIARRFHCISNIGKLLDPLADKLLNISALLCIFTAKQRPVYLMILLLVAVKELLMIAGGILLFKNSVVVFSDWAGKLATAGFTARSFLTMLSLIYPKIEPWNTALLLVATGLSYFALIHYWVRFSVGAYSRRKKARREGSRAEA